MKISLYQRIARVLVIWLTTAAIITYLSILLDFIFCLFDVTYLRNNIFQTLSEYLFPLGYTFFYVFIGFLLFSIDTPEEFQEMHPEEVIRISTIIVVLILIVAGFYLLQFYFCRKGARLSLGITLGLTIPDTIRAVIVLIFSFSESGSFSIITAEGILGLLLHCALIFCLVMSLRFTWDNYEYYE